MIICKGYPNLETCLTKYESFHAKVDADFVCQRNRKPNLDQSRYMLTVSKCEKKSFIILKIFLRKEIKNCKRQEKEQQV